MAKKKTTKKKTRTKKPEGLSVITTVRGDEPQTARTLHNAASKAGCPVELIVVFDGQLPDENLEADQLLAHTTPRGIGPSRHRGIMAAKYEVVLLVDAHMNFEQDYGQKILHHYRLKKHAKDITCGRCIPAHPDLEPMAGTDGYTGARFALKSEESGGEKWCLSGKWSEQSVDNEIGCVFGACYSFRREWYKKIGEPLNLLAGWFGDEEYLSIASWLAGGRCFLLDYWVSHLFRDKPSFQWGRKDWMQPALNRARLIHLFPCEEDLKNDLLAWNALSVRNADYDYEQLIIKDYGRKEVIAAKLLWEKWADAVPGFMGRWVDAEAAPLEQRQQERLSRQLAGRTTDAPRLTAPEPGAPHVQTRDYIVCPNCGAYDSFRVTRTVTVNGEKRRYGHCKEPNCKKKGVMVSRNSGQTIYWGRDMDRI